VLVGNGSPSLKQRVHDVERELELLRKEREREAAERRRMEDRRENRMVAAARMLGPYLASLASAGAVYLGLKT
jgi:hypothetical protein